MEPTLYTNDVLLLERISVRLQRLEKGDIVISKCPNNPEQNICKRIVGLPGDKIRNGFTVTTVNSKFTFRIRFDDFFSRELSCVYRSFDVFVLIIRRDRETNCAD